MNLYLVSFEALFEINDRRTITAMNWSWFLQCENCQRVSHAEPNFNIAASNMAPDEIPYCLANYYNFFIKIMIRRNDPINQTSQISTPFVTRPFVSFADALRRWNLIPSTLQGPPNQIALILAICDDVQHNVQPLHIQPCILRLLSRTSTLWPARPIGIRSSLVHTITRCETAYCLGGTEFFFFSLSSEDTYYAPVMDFLVWR